MKITKFTCNKNHIFYLPLDLPKEISSFAKMLTDLKCPICHCNSYYITVRLEEYEINEIKGE